MTSEELREHGHQHENEAQACADHGCAIGWVTAGLGPVIIVFMAINRNDLMLWALGIQLTLFVAELQLHKRFRRHADAAIDCYTVAELMEKQKPATSSTSKKAID